MKAPLQTRAFTYSVLQHSAQCSIINISSGLAMAPKKISAGILCGQAGIHIFSQALVNLSSLIY